MCLYDFLPNVLSLDFFCFDVDSMSGCTWYRDTVLVHLSVGKIRLYCLLVCDLFVGCPSTATSYTMHEQPTDKSVVALLAGYFYHETRRAVNALVYMDQTYEIFQALCKPRKYAPKEPVFKMREFLFLLKV